MSSAKRRPSCLGLNVLIRRGIVVHICVDRLNRSPLVQVIDCHPFGTKPLPAPMLAYCESDPQEQNSVTIESTYVFLSMTNIWKYCEQRLVAHSVRNVDRVPMRFYLHEIFQDMSILTPEQNGQQFADDITKCTSCPRKLFWSLIQILFNCAPGGTNDNHHWCGSWLGTW